MLYDESVASDTNARVSALLRDLAAVQTSPQSRWGYRRAASAILSLDEPLEALVQKDGTLRKIPHIGPSSTRVILELLRTGRSTRSSARSPGAADRRRWSAAAGCARRFSAGRRWPPPCARRLAGPRLADYRGDLQMHSTCSDGRARR